MSSASDSETLILTRYGRLGASSRLRYYNYLPGLKSLGLMVRADNFFCDDYLRCLYHKQPGKRRFVLNAYLRRLKTMINAPEKLIIEYELFPGIPYFIEKLFLRKRRYILNFDDDVWCKYTNKALLNNKFDQLVKHASGIIAANDFLLEKIRSLNPNVIKIPTALDLDAYCCNRKKFRRFTLVWIGNPATYPYLQQLAPVLLQLRHEIDFTLLIIGGKNLDTSCFGELDVRCVEWSIRCENELLCRCHVGIMPLPQDDDFARGKSAYKLIQYSAGGIPMVADDVGENRNVVEPGRNGFLVHNIPEWIAAIKELFDNPELRENYGSYARSRATEFSIRKYTPIMAEFIKESFGS